MTNTPYRFIALTCGLLALVPGASLAQSTSQPSSGYDKHLPRAPLLTALRNDLRRVEEQMRLISTRPEFPGLQREAEAIAQDVRLLEGQVLEHMAGRHDGPVGGTAEVNWMRQRIQSLRRDILALPPQTKPFRKPA